MSNSGKLCFPERVLEQHLVILGKTGAGKSSALRHIVEHLLRHKKRVCIIDIKGDWWGLKSSADGKSAGFPVIAFGSFREPKAADVPINSRSGQHIAELITSGNRPCIIGFRGWMPGEITDFWLEFAPALFNRNEGELYVVISECHNFAPKGKVLDPKAGKVLHWTNRLLSEGRGLGMTFLLDSQRPQKVHNDTLTCCETLVAMRVTHAADRQALKDWIDGCGDKSTGTELLNNVASLARGEAYVWSPEIGFGPQRLKFPMFETFDSFAPAQLQHKVSESGWSAVDLDAVKQKLASVIEEAKDNDPRELKAKIAELRRQLENRPEQVVTKEVHIADPEAILNAILKRDEEWRIAVLEFRSNLEAATKNAAATTFTPPAPFAVGRLELRNARGETVPLPAQPSTVSRRLDYTPIPQMRPPSNNGDVHLKPGALRMLAACAQWYPKAITEAQVAAQTGVKRSSGTFSSYKSNLVTAGLVSVGNGMWSITNAGMRQIGSSAPPTPQRTDDVLAIWRPKLKPGANRMLNVLLSHHGRAIPVDQLAEESGIAASSGTFSSYLSNLATADLIVKPQRGTVAANAETLLLGRVPDVRNAN